MDRPVWGYTVSVLAAATSAKRELASATALAENALATWRIVRLVRDDYVTQPLRDRVYDMLDGDAPGEDAGVGTCQCGHPKEQHDFATDGAVCAAPDCACSGYAPIASARVARLRHPKLATLVECPYCLGVWAAGAVVLLRTLRLNWLVRVLAVSALASELARRYD